MTEPARRHTLTDAYNDALATIERLTTRHASTTASAELTRNAKGETQVAVKATGETIAAAEAAAVDAYDRLCARYPTTPAVPATPRERISDAP
jgi:hypothetical protein